MDKTDSLGAFKPDIGEASQRWEAFYVGELVDRPVVCVTAPLHDKKAPPPISYHEKAFGDLDSIVRRGLQIAGATFWGGEAVPSFYPSIGPDEISVFCGAELQWHESSADTNWSLPCVDAWRDFLPIQLQVDHPLWQRQQALYRRAAGEFQGKVLLVAPDLHTNMDLLAGLRGPQKLCLDLIDSPDRIDQAMVDARAVFRQLWKSIREAGQMDVFGYCLESHGLYSTTGSATLQCDFSLMMSPNMFRRWVLPALEEEAVLVGRVVYHWDGPGALVHKEDILGCKGLQTLSFVPGAGNGALVDYIDLLMEFQARGKSVHVWGTPEECKRMHKELQPEKVFYCTQTNTQKDAEDLLQWFVEHT